MTPFELERGWTAFFPKDAFLNKSIVMHPTSESFYEMMQKSERYSTRCIEEAVDYNKIRWDKSHKLPEFKVEYPVLVSTVNFNNISGPRKLKDSFAVPFVIKALLGKNSVEVILTGDLAKKHPNHPVSLVKPVMSEDKFIKRDKPVVVIPCIDDVENKNVHKILRHKMIRKYNRDVRLYLVRYRHRPADQDEWLEEKNIPDAQKYLRRYRADER